MNFFQCLIVEKACNYKFEIDRRGLLESVIVGGTRFDSDWKF